MYLSHKYQKIILGGGISGLLQAYYNPEALLVSDQIGGQLKAPFQLGPKYLHVDEYSKRFFSEIGLNPDTKRIKIGFFYKDTLHSNNTEENRKLYFQKTRGEDTPYQSSMSADMTEFDSFDIGTDEIIDFLKNKIKNKIILGKVERIDNKKNEITVNGESLKYEKLISTIPLNVFLFLNNKPEIAKLFKSFSTTFILDETIWDLEDYDYVYFSEPHIHFHRITRTDLGTVLEFKGDDISKNDSGIAEINRFILKTGQLVQNQIKIDLQHVEFFGRYGTWNHSILINTLLKQIYDMY